APAYSALRLRQAGIAFDHTLFVVFCHGTRRWLLDVGPNIAPGDLHTVLGISLLERASLELADVVVSPSAYLVDWMRGRGWQLPPQTFVIPHVSRAGATGQPPPLPVSAESNRVDPVAFFGRPAERTGVRPSLPALNALEPG